MVAAAALALGDAADGEVVAFGGAAGEDDFLRGPRRSLRRSLPRGVDGFARLLAEGVADAAGVAVVLGEVRQHRGEDAGVDARGGVIVEVEWGGSGHGKQNRTKRTVNPRLRGLFLRTNTSIG